MPSSERFDFQNRNGQLLSGRLDLPDGQPKAYALFAHCFTCNKNVHAAARIARGLRELGFGVLRFDFTGLGNSEGDFANTNFSSNLDDLRSAIDALRATHQAPSILVGHSLGGAAVMFLASEIAEVKLVASVGAPSEPIHVLNLIDESMLEQIEQHGTAEVSLAGKTFSIQKQFVEDVTGTSLQNRLQQSRKPALIFHAPNDNIVGIEHAKKIYEAMNHPKSFVSLDGADHLLSEKKDSQFVADVLATWAARFLPDSISTDTSIGHAGNDPQETMNVPKGVAVRERDGTLTQDVVARQHSIVADEPANIGAADLGMTPYELLLAGLGACTSMTLRMYAKRKGIPLEKVTVNLEHDRIHAEDCESCENQVQKVDRIRRVVRLDGDLTDTQRQRMLEISEMCPVHRTLMNQMQILTEAYEVDELDRAVN